jgi:ribose 5-phosphate isomerase B
LDGDFGKRIEKAVEAAFGSGGASLHFETARRPEERIVGSKHATFRIAIGADHRGYELKQGLLRYLRDLGHLVVDCGMREGETVDYPTIALRVSEKVVRKDCEFGVVIDAVGIGSAIAANKIAGIRAAVCYDVEAARSSRLHNDANVLSLGASFVNRGLARRLVRTWLETPFEGGRHVPRLEKIAKLEKDGLDAGI